MIIAILCSYQALSLEILKKMVDRYEHTYRYKKVTNDKGEIMFVLTTMRVAFAVHYDEPQDKQKSNTAEAGH